MTLAGFAERLQRLAVQGGSCDGGLAAAFHCNCCIIDAQICIRGIASQHVRTYWRKVIGMLRSEVLAQLSFIAVYCSPRAPNKSTESAGPEFTMVHSLQLFICGYGRVLAQLLRRELL